MFVRLLARTSRGECPKLLSSQHTQSPPQHVGVPFGTVFVPRAYSSASPVDPTSSSTSIPGLHVLRDFITVSERRAAFDAAVALSGRAEVEAGKSSRPDAVSTAHNVNSKEKFQSVALALDNGETAVCEHFSNYASSVEGGHKLTYFRGTIPDFGGVTIMERLGALHELQDEVASSRARLSRSANDHWRWRLTLNHYPTGQGDSVPRLGFPWHRDLTANGAATMILNLGADGALEFGEEPQSDTGDKVDGLRYSSSDHAVVDGDEVVPLERITLTDGDVLLLTGPARWEYLHRVVPCPGGTERVSLVYGVW